MKNYKLFLMLGCIFLLAYGLYQFGLHQGKENSKNVITQHTSKNTILYWHDPMVPGHKFDKPGKSPFMDMDLVPVYAESKENSHAVKIDTKLQQNLGIRTAPVEEKFFNFNHEFTGNVVYDERTTQVIQARAAGYLEKLLVRTQLESVRKDQVLAEIFIPEWIAVQEEYLAIKRMKLSSKELLNAAKQRMRLVGMSDSHIQLIQSTNVVQPQLKITAPIDGIITELSAREGMTFSNATPLFKINSLKTVWVYAQIPESIIHNVHVGDLVQSTTPGMNNIIFKGKVNAILPEINSVTRTLTARIELKNINTSLLPGMFARVYFNSDSLKKSLVIPTEAIIQTGKRNIVIVVENENFIPVEISLGNENNDETEIVNGLNLGQRVVISGQFLIDSEASLKGVQARMLPNHNSEVSTTQEMNHSKGITE